MHEDRLETIIGRKMGVPYDVDHFYMPLVSTKDVIESKVYNNLVLDEDYFDIDYIKKSFDKITPYINDSIIPHDDAKSLGLGLGYGEPETYIYDAMIKAHQPDVIIEIGCGVSTYYARGATDTRIICVEPYPGPGFPDWCEQNNIELWNRTLQDSIEDLPLYGKTLLFVDSTHVCKITSELHLVFTKLLPKLTVGSIIHFHDIFLPFPCLRPDHNSFPQTVNWYESVLLGVFLRSAPQYKTMLPQYWMGHFDKGRELLRRIPFYARTGAEGSSYWIEKAG